MRSLFPIVSGLSMLMTLGASTHAQRPLSAQRGYATAPQIARQDSRVLANTTALLRQYNADVMAGKSATVPLFTVLKTLVQMLEEPHAPTESLTNSTLEQRTKTEYEVLTHVNQEIIQITHSLANPS